MKVPIRSYCRLGIVHSMAYPEAAQTPSSFIRTLHHLMENPWFDIIELGQLPFPEQEAAVVRDFAQAHVGCTYSAHGRLFRTGLNINSLDEAERFQAIHELETGVDEAYSLGALDFQFLSRGWSPDTLEKHLAALVDSTITICRYVAKKGRMPVVLEIFDKDIDKCSLIGPAPLAARYAQAVCREVDNFGLMVDCSHIPMLRETLDEAIDPIRQYIRHAHMGNTLISDPLNPCYGDLHPRFGYPGSENDTEYLAAYLSKLLEIGYLNPVSRPILSFEVKPRPDEDSELVIAGCKRILEEAWRMV
ncbi:MAG: sugar phosphate isomerase/epimerase [Spirochaetia bacterium]|nr:sugar phosphate isomerase/epimerase [Spirochaetia bacterium]